MATAICGLGGVGKTTLAISYAHTKRNDYGYIFWIDADDIVQLDGSYRNIAQHLLSKDTASWEANAIRAAIKEWFASDVSRKDNKPYLIIFDNVDNPAAIYEFVPKTKNGYCLFTSRLQDLRPLVKGNSYQLDVLTPTEAIEYFEKAANLDCNDAQALQEATTLAEELGRLPLALEQAAALIGDMSFTFAEYRRMYQRQHLQLLNQGSLFKRPLQRESSHDLEHQF